MATPNSEQVHPGMLGDSQPAGVTPPQFGASGQWLLSSMSLTSSAARSEDIEDVDDAEDTEDRRDHRQAEWHFSVPECQRTPSLARHHR